MARYACLVVAVIAACPAGNGVVNGEDTAASIGRRQAGDARPLGTRLPLEFKPDMDKQRRDDDGAADDGAHRRDLGMDQPDPDGPKDRLERAKQRRNGGRNEPRPHREKGEPDAKIEDAEGEEETHVALGNG